MLSETNQTATVLLLVRHGENEWVTSNRLAGRTPGVHLNQRGRQQAAALVSWLAAQPICAIYSSPLVRCTETAQPLADSRQLSLCEEPGLLEVDYGEWMGGDLKDLSQRADWQMVQHYPSTFRFPGGESLREVQQRAVTALERIATAHPNQVVAAFSHGDVIRTTLAHFLGTPIDLFQRLQIATASVSVVAIHGGRPAVLAVNLQHELPVFEIKPKSATAATETTTAGTTAPETNGTPTTV